MMNKYTLIRPAGSAIATALALVAAPSFAQDIAPAASEPVLTVPTLPTAQTSTAPAPSAPAPVVIAELPDASEPAVAVDAAPEVAVEPVAPVEQAVVESEATPAAAPSRAPSQPTRTARVAAADPSPATDFDFTEETVAADVPVIEDGESADGAAVLASAETASANPVSTGAESKSFNADLVTGGGALALGLGFIGLFMAGASRRRRGARAGAAEAVNAPVTRPLRKPMGERTAPTAAAAPAFAVNHSRSQPATSKWDNAGFVNASPAVSAPAVPQTAEQRKALIDRLTRARPDRAIPFKSPAARRRRARLIVQTLRQRLAEQPNLDFRRFYESFARRRTAMA